MPGGSGSADPWATPLLRFVVDAIGLVSTAALQRGEPLTWYLYGYDYGVATEPRMLREHEIPTLPVDQVTFHAGFVAGSDVWLDRTRGQRAN